ncbi:MAG: M36 family metallopeptidase [Saprospiraceae bacterium]|nr:M36 family metallopeptidase [Saprospiraceae bacterium]
MKDFLLYFFIFGCVGQLSGQQFSARAYDVLLHSKIGASLSSDEIRDAVISSQHYGSISGLHYIYLQQRFEGVEVENALSTMAFAFDGTCVHHVTTFAPDISARVLRKKKIAAHDALKIAFNEMGHHKADLIKLDRARDTSGCIWFDSPNISRRAIPVRLLWTKVQTSYVLAYETWIEERSGDHVWRVLLDAATGAIIRQEDQWLKCSFDHLESTSQFSVKPSVGHHRSFLTSLSSSYTVLPLYTESPSHGEWQVVTDPADPVASPFGWHDTDGVPGAEFQDTRGNNVFTQEDIDGNDILGNRAFGGQDLSFDFTISSNVAPQDNLDAALTNLFYWSNINHDVFYHYGFDEAAGNYQVNNYGSDGLGEDPVFTDAQDGSDRNNAQFLTLGDGSSARMEMFLWGQDLFDSEVSFSPALPLLGQSISSIESDFSLQNKLAALGPIVGELVLLEDPSGHLACADSLISNASELAGKIVLVDRGLCFFVEKVRNAARFGAIAVIVCNNEPGDPVIMSGDGQDITIPTVMIRQSDCDLLKHELIDKDIMVTIRRAVREEDLDSSLDNLIITHEYSHGLSIRLTGGSRVAVCLNNEEQMGEGWSDYFGLMLTTDWDQAAGNQRRGVGTYLVNQNKGGVGIRNFPYSTNMSINPVTYNDIRDFSIPHGVGSVWCSMLWDMTWEIIETEGVSTDIYHGKAGNNVSVQLVVEGLKLQPCNPGFVDGRDAILQADSLLYGGRHQYAIWKAFARRGLGIGAHQNNANSTSDGISSFDLPENFKTRIESFSADDSLRSIVLKWQSSQEFGNKEFQLERSLNGLSYQPLANIPGHETKTTPTAYAYEDRNVDPGILYHYRLSRTDDRNIRTEVAIDSAIIVDVDELVVFPNPSNSVTFLKVAPSIPGPFSLAIFDPMGRTVHFEQLEEAELHQSHNLDTTRFSPGVYVVEISNGLEQFRRKLVVL